MFRRAGASCRSVTAGKQPSCERASAAIRFCVDACEREDRCIGSFFPRGARGRCRRRRSRARCIVGKAKRMDSRSHRCVVRVSVGGCVPRSCVCVCVCAGADSCSAGERRGVWGDGCPRFSAGSSIHPFPSPASMCVCVCVAHDGSHMYDTYVDIVSTRRRRTTQSRMRGRRIDLIALSVRCRRAGWLAGSRSRPQISRVSEIDKVLHFNIP